MAEEQEKYAGIKRIANDKGSRKLLLMAGGVIIVSCVWAFWPSHKATVAGYQDNLHSAPHISGPDSGGVVVNSAYEKALRQSDENRLNQAKSKGGDAFPTLRLNPQNSKLPVVLGDTNQHGSDDLNDNKKKNTSFDNQDNALPVAPKIFPTKVEKPAEVQQMNMADIQRMSQYLRGIKMAVKPASVVYVYAPKDAKNTTTVADNRKNGFMGSGSDSSDSLASISGNGKNTQVADNSVKKDARLVGGIDGGPEFKLPAAGTVLYAKLVGRVNSDSNGPVIGEVEQGAFSGSRIIGSFSFGEKGVMITFNTMTVPYKNDDGEDETETVGINAVAVDSKHLGTAMATSIDNHMLARVGAQFGSAFLQGLGQAVAQSGSSAYMSPYGGTTVTNPTMNLSQEMAMAVGQGASQAGSIFQSIYGSQKTTIIVEQGTPFGLLFLDKQS